MSSLEFKGASGYDRNTYGTWDIVMQKIENMAAKDTGEEGPAAQNAIKLFRTFAFLDHANIPEGLFKSAAENYMDRNLNEEANAGLPLSVKLLHHKSLFLNEEGEQDKFQFVSGIQVLLSLSLIKSHNQLYSMHLLVHAWRGISYQKQRLQISITEPELCCPAQWLLTMTLIIPHSVNYSHHILDQVLYMQQS